MPVVERENGVYNFLVSGNNGRVGGDEPLEDYSEDSLCQQLAKIYGLVLCDWEYLGPTAGETYTVMGHTVNTITDGVITNVNDIYDELGFVEGVTIGQPSAGEYSAIVHNGKLYVLLSEYDSAVGDNKCINGVRLNATNGLASLGEMLSRPDHFIRYESLRGTWSEVESYLHQHSPLEVIGLVVPHGYVAGETEIIWPGLTYGNSL